MRSFIPFASLAIALPVLTVACTGDGPITGPVPEKPVVKETITLSALSRTQQTGSVGAVVADSLAVRVATTKGEPVAGVWVRFTAASGHGSLSADSVASDAQGRAAVAWTLPTQPGEYQATARAESDSVAFGARAEAGQIARLRLIADTTRALALGDTITISVRAEDSHGNPLARTAALTAHESRWLSDWPVYDGSTLPGKQLRVTGPGAVQLHALIDTVRSNDLTLRVRPAMPMIYRVEAPAQASAGDSIRLRGYRMQDVASSSITLEGQVVPVVARDSASLVLRVPAPPAGDCRGAGRPLLSVPGATPLADLSVRRARSGEIDLQIGQAVRLRDTDLSCLRLAPTAGGEYAIAFADTRGIERSRSVAEPRKSFPEYDAYGFSAFYPIKLADRAPTESPAAVAPSLSALELRTASRTLDSKKITPDVVRLSPSTGTVRGEHFLSRSTAWKAGDRGAFQLKRYANYTETMAWGDTTVEESGTVWRVYDGRFAVVIMDRDSALFNVASSPASKPWPEALDQQMQELVRTAVPLYRSALTSNYPTTGGSGQLVVIVGNRIQSVAFVSGTSEWVQMGTIMTAKDAGGRTFGELMNRHVLFHEVAHSFQQQHMEERGPNFSHSYTNWAIEGGAEFLAAEASRAVEGYGFADNKRVAFQFAGPMGIGLVYTFNQSATPGLFTTMQVYSFADGYGTSHWYFLDLVHRALANGRSYADAVQAVSRGSLDGWFGRSSPLSGRGLQAEMSALLGAGWDPVPSLLEGIASIALDDRTTATRYQVPSILKAGEHFTPAGTLRAGSGQELTRYGGGTAFGYFLLSDLHGGSYRMSAGVPGVEWLLVRGK